MKKWMMRDEIIALANTEAQQQCNNLHLYWLLGIEDHQYNILSYLQSFPGKLKSKTGNLGSDFIHEKIKQTGLAGNT